MAMQSLKCDGRKKMEQSILSVALTDCVAIATLSTVASGRSVFVCYESTLAVHSENPFMVSVCKLRKKIWASAGCPVHEIWTSAKDFGYP